MAVARRTEVKCGARRRLEMRLCEKVQEVWVYGNCSLVGLRRREIMMLGVSSRLISRAG
jgi:hypothetical protein